MATLELSNVVSVRDFVASAREAMSRDATLRTVRGEHAWREGCPSFLATRSGDENEPRVILKLALVQPGVELEEFADCELSNNFIIYTKTGVDPKVVAELAARAGGKLGHIRILDDVQSDLTAVARLSRCMYINKCTLSVAQLYGFSRECFETDIEVESWVPRKMDFSGSSKVPGNLSIFKVDGTGLSKPYFDGILGHKFARMLCTHEQARGIKCVPECDINFEGGRFDAHQNGYWYSNTVAVVPKFYCDVVFVRNFEPGSDVGLADDFELFSARHVEVSVDPSKSQAMTEALPKLLNCAEHLVLQVIEDKKEGIGFGVSILVDKRKFHLTTCVSINGVGSDYRNIGGVIEQLIARGFIESR